MSKTFLIILSILLLLMGIIALIPSWELSDEPTWYAVVKILIAVVGLIVAFTDKGRGTTTPSSSQEAPQETSEENPQT